MNNQSGVGGILGLLGLAALFFFLREFYPPLAKLFLILSGVAALGVAVLVITVIFFAFHKPKKTPEQQQLELVVSMLQKGGAQLADIRNSVAKIQNPEIRCVGESACSVTERVFRTLKDQPESVPRVSRFFSDYLPSLQSILAKYIRLESAGQTGPETAEEIRSCLKDMEFSMEKLYANIFAYNKQDLSREMAAMNRLCREDGLLADSGPLLENLSPKPSAPAEELGPAEDPEVTAGTLL